MSLLLNDITGLYQVTTRIMEKVATKESVFKYKGCVFFKFWSVILAMKYQNMACCLDV